MPVCAVRTCGERGQFACKKSEGQIISFHRFPSDHFPRIRAKWIKATGQHKTTLWQPTKESTICSKHFKKEDFLTCTDLKISAVPICEESLLDEHNEPNWTKFKWDHTESTSFQIKESSKSVHPIESYTYKLQMPSTSSSHEAEELEQITDTQDLGEMRNMAEVFSDGFMNDSVENSDTDSADEKIKLPQYDQSIRNKEFTAEDKDIPIEYEPGTTISPRDQPESNEPIAIHDSEPEFSETSSEIEFTELDSSETKSSQLSVDAIEKPPDSDEQLPYGMQISKPYSTRKRLIVDVKDQMNTNIKMYRIDPVTNTVRPVQNILKENLILDPAKPPVIIRPNRNKSKKSIYLIKDFAASLDGNSQNIKLNQNCSSQLQYVNNTIKIISPKTGSNSHRVITLSKHTEEQKKVYSTPVPKLVQINQKRPAKKSDIAQKIWKATKLNTTSETADRVKKHQKLKLNSIIKKITPSAKLSTPDGCCRPQLTLASSNVAKPKPLVSRPTTPGATPADSMPTLTVSIPTSIVPTPSPAYSMSTRADSTPAPADSTPIPADSTPSPADSTPSPADSTPTHADSMPIPAYSTPAPADSTPTRADSMLALADSTPRQADSTPTPADSMLTPAVSSSAVQKLNDSNIHKPDEYDTFAKHVATQLRQLSLESYLSAQGEIQSTLSRYRLCDLNALIKKT